jgi:TPR repeat protein
MTGDFFSKLFGRQTFDARTPVQLTEAVKKGDRSAIDSLMRLADNGDADAQLDLGVLYATGTGFPQSYVTAAFWYAKAADQDIPNAQYNLGLMYWSGDVVDQDFSVALACLEKAASNGHVNARNRAEQLRPALKALAEEQALNDLVGRDVIAGVRNDVLANRYLLELKSMSNSEDIRHGIQAHLAGLGVSPSVMRGVERCIELAKKFSSVSGAPVSHILQYTEQRDLDGVFEYINSHPNS